MRIRDICVIRGRFLSWNVAVTGAAVKVAFGEKAFFGSLRTFPADNPLHIIRPDKRIIMFHLAVAFGATGGCSHGNFRVDRFDQI